MNTGGRVTVAAGMEVFVMVGLGAGVFVDEEGLNPSGGGRRVRVGGGDVIDAL